MTMDYRRVSIGREIVLPAGLRSDSVVGTPVANEIVTLHQPAGEVIDVGDLAEVITLPVARREPSSHLAENSREGGLGYRDKSRLGAFFSGFGFRSRQPKFRIKLLTVVASGLWGLGIGLGIMGASIVIEIILQVSALALLGSGLYMARSFLPRSTP